MVPVDCGNAKIIETQQNVNAGKNGGSYGKPWKDTDQIVYTERVGGSSPSPPTRGAAPRVEPKS
jgi:hypothetical protein